MFNYIYVYIRFGSHEVVSKNARPITYWYCIYNDFIVHTAHRELLHTPLPKKGRVQSGEKTGFVGSRILFPRLSLADRGRTKKCMTHEFPSL